MTSYKLDPVRRRFASLYKNLFRRCYPADPWGLRYRDNFKNGGMVDEWLYSKNSFIFWCQQQNPPDGYCLERTDLNKPYGPDNCSFVSLDEKYRKLSTNNWVEYKGQRMIFSDLIRLYSVVSKAAVLDRLRRGFSLEEALTMPSRKKSKNYIEQLKLRYKKRDKARKTKIAYRRKLQQLIESVYRTVQKTYQFDRKWKLVVQRAKEDATPIRQAAIQECEQAYSETEQVQLLIDSLLAMLFKLVKNCPQLYSLALSSAALSIGTILVSLQERQCELMALSVNPPMLNLFIHKRPKWP